MARKCCVKNCKLNGDGNRKRNEDVGIDVDIDVPVHQFPKDPQLRDQWIEKLLLQDLHDSHQLFICYKHFLKSDYQVIKQSDGKITYILKNEAIPTILQSYDYHPDPVIPTNEENFLNINFQDQIDDASFGGLENETNPNIKLTLNDEVEKNKNEMIETLEASNLESDHQNRENKILALFNSANDENQCSDTLIVSNEESAVDAENGGKPEEPQVKVAEEAPVFPDLKSQCSEEIKRVPQDPKPEETVLQPSVEKIQNGKPDELVSKETSISISTSKVVDDKKVKNEKSGLKDKSKITNKAGLKFFPGAKLEAKDFNDKWYTAKVVETDWVDREVLIHFDKWSTRFDEWIPMDSSRLRVLQVRSSEQNWLPPIQEVNMREFQVGERILATWADGRKYPAKVRAVLGNDKYDVLFDDGYQKIVRSSKMTKIASSTAKDFEKPPEPDPYIGSKQERRDKKRKHTIMELFQHKKKPKTEGDKPLKKDDIPSSEGNETLNSEVGIGGGSDSGLVDYYDSSCELTQTFDSSKLKIKNYSKRKRESLKPDSDDDDDGPEWVDGQPKGIESYSVDGNEGSRRSVIIPDKKLLPGWQKHFVQRKTGSSAGKWDVLFLHKLTGKKFRTRNDIRMFFETQGIGDYDPDMFDFCIHRRKKTKSKNDITEPSKKIKTLLPKTKTQPTPDVLINPSSTNISVPISTPPINPADSAVFIGGLRVEMEDSAYKCPKDGCNKTFRKENLLQMHIKHYHPEYTKYLGSTPNVADLAYARTIGESIVESTPKKTIRKFNDKVNSPLLNSFVASPDLPDPINREDSKLDLMSPVSSFSTEVEEELGKKSDTSAMSPSTLFDLKVREEKVQSGIKTLLPVRSSSDPQKNDKGDKVKSADESIPFEKGKGQRRRQLSEYSSDTSVKSKRRTDDYGELDDSALDTEGPSPLVFRFSRRKSDAKSDDNSQSSQLNDSQLDKNAVRKDTEPEDGDGVMMMINGEMVKVEQLRREEIINCTCGFTEEDGLMIQCDLCLCWQHGHCNAIEREKDVPEKYICYICRYPYRQRPSKKYLHDQDWIKEGKLLSLSKRTKDQLVINQRAAMLKRSYDLVGALLQIQQILHSLRVKINVAQKKDHPKLYLWAKNWEKSEIATPNVDPIPVMEIINSEPELIDNPVEINSDLNTEVHPPTSDYPDAKSITTDSELMKILEEDADEIKAAKKINGSILHDLKPENLEAEIKEKTENEDNKSDVKIDDKEVKNPSLIEERAILTPFIPEPEAPIDPSECRLRLLEHIEHFQDHIDAQLTTVEAQLCVLEAIDPHIDDSSPDVQPRIKQTVQMLLRDLDTVRKLASLC